MAGNKVQITQRFRGREMAFKEIGLDRLKNIAEELSEVGKIEAPPRWAGRAASLVMAPDKAKIEALKANADTENPQKKRNKPPPHTEPSFSKGVCWALPHRGEV